MFSVQRPASTPAAAALDRFADAIGAGDVATPTALWSGIAGLLLGLALTGVWLVARDADAARPPLQG